MTIQTHEPYVPEWTIGDRLRRIRRDSGLSQAKFSERIEVGEKRYAAWESDTNAPPSKELLAVARRIELIFGRDASLWLLGMESVEGDTPTPDPGPDGGEAAPDVNAVAQLAARKRGTGRRHGGGTTDGYLDLSAAA